MSQTWPSLCIFSINDAMLCLIWFCGQPYHRCIKNLETSHRFGPPWSSMSWILLGGATTSCLISGILASTTWWAQPSDGTKTDRTASPNFRSDTCCVMNVFMWYVAEIWAWIWGMPVLEQEVVVDPYLRRVKIENSRYLSWQKQISSQQGVVWRHWKALRRLLTSERGAWANRSDQFRHFSSSKA